MAETPAVGSFTDTLANLALSSPDAILVVDAAGSVLFASPAVETIFGYAPEELVGHNYDILLPDDRRAVHADHHRGFVTSRPLQGRPMGVGLDLIGRSRSGRRIPIEVALVPIESDGDVIVGAFIRDITARRRTLDQLSAINTLMAHLLEGSPLSETLDVVSVGASNLLTGAGSWIVRVADGGQELEVLAACGAASSLAGRRFDARQPEVQHMIAAEGPELVDDLSAAELPAEVRSLAMGPAVVVPLGTADQPRAALAVARRTGEPAYGSGDAESLGRFADAAGVALGLRRARDQLEEMASVVEHERIARDLHDTVIQRIFGTAMQLESVVHLAEGPVGDRINQAVEDLDEIIRDIRTTIFNLQRPVSGSSGLRDSVREVTDEYSSGSDLAIRVGFEGAVDTLVAHDLATQVPIVVREALSNVVRHAHARSVEIVVAAGEDLTVTVADDGVGIPAEPSGGHGLANLAARAEEQGGELDVRWRRPTGTLLRWRVPLGAGAG